MTESPPVWFIGSSPASESEIQRLVVEALRVAGWEVMVTSQDRAMRWQSRGLVDVIAWKHNHSLLIECKTAKGKLNDAQKRFKVRLAPHEGPHLRRITVRHPAMIDEWLAPGQGAWREEAHGQDKN